MKRVLGGVIVAAALSGSALAADLPSRSYAKAPATADPTYNWSGWYGGLNAGWVGGSGSASNDASIVSTSNVPENAQAMARGATNTAGASSGFIGGGQFGYNYQFSHLFVAGFEADIQGLTGAQKRSSSAVPLMLPDGEGGEELQGTFVTHSTTRRGLSYLGTLRARIGVLVAPSFLLYATGGLAYGGAKADTTILQSATDTGSPPPPTLTSGSFSQTRVGYAVGAGGEWMFSSNWSAKLEYLYYDLGSATYATGGIANDVTHTSLPGTGVDAIATSSKVRFNDNIVRVGVNYHFGSPAASQY
jgi:outer membrane immunogenic protein